MLRHRTNTLVNRNFLRTIGWKVSKLLKFLVNFVPKESGSGVKVCKTKREGKTFGTMKSDFVVDLSLNAASNLEFGLLTDKRFPDWQGTVEEISDISNSWEPIVPNTEKAIMDIFVYKKCNYLSGVLV